MIFKRRTPSGLESSVEWAARRFSSGHMICISGHNHNPPRSHARHRSLLPVNRHLLSRGCSGMGPNRLPLVPAVCGRHDGQADIAPRQARNILLSQRYFWIIQRTVLRFRFVRNGTKRIFGRGLFSFLVYLGVLCMNYRSACSLYQR